MRNWISKNFAWCLLVAFLLVFLLLATRGCQKRGDTIGEISTIQENRQTEPERYIDETGKEHAVKKVDIGSKEALQISYKKEYDSAIKLLGVNARQIEKLTLVATRAEGKVRLLLDSIGHFSYQDSYAEFSVSGDSLSYSFTDSLTQVTYWDRKWFLGRKTHYIDAYSTNPNVKILNIEQAQVKIKDPGRFGVGPFVGYGLPFGVSAGVSLHYSIIRF